MSNPIVPRSVPIEVRPWSASEFAFLIIAINDNNPQRSAALINTCCAGVCGCCRCEVEGAVGFVGLLGVGIGFELPFGFDMLGFACESPGFRLFEGYGVEPLVGGAVGFAMAPGACVGGFCEYAPGRKIIKNVH